MAKWAQLAAHIRSTYVVMDGSTDDLLTIRFEIDDGRTQTATVVRDVTTGDEEWVMISSPIGLVTSIDLEKATRMAYDQRCGGIVVLGRWVFLHHAAPLANLDANGLDGPLVNVVVGADRIEAKLLGSDEL